MKIVLASESASRRRAMDLLGLPYHIRPSRIDEKSIREDDPRKLVQALSEAKARKVADEIQDGLIVAGDAVAAMNGRIYEKPADQQEAFRFLKSFSENTVEFVSGVAVLNVANGKLVSSVHSSQIVFRKLSDAEVSDYIQRYPVLQFAGAFEADGVIRFADRVSGSYNFSTGVAITALVDLLRQQGVNI